MVTHVRIRVDGRTFDGLLMEWRKYRSGGHGGEEWHGRVLYVTGSDERRTLTETWLPSTWIFPLK